MKSKQVTMAGASENRRQIRRAILVGALGYFVDLFDIHLFNVLRTASLTEIGVVSARQAAVVPLIFCWQFMLFFASELGRAVLPSGMPFDPKTCMLAFYVGASGGDVLAGSLSQWLESRRRPVLGLYGLGIGVLTLFMVAGPALTFNPTLLAVIYFALGLTGGGWSMMVTLIAEQFGTNVRATATITLTNLLRGCTIPMLLTFNGLKGQLGVPQTALLIGLTIYALALVAMLRLKETHGRELDFVEQRAS